MSQITPSQCKVNWVVLSQYVMESLYVTSFGSQSNPFISSLLCFSCWWRSRYATGTEKALSKWFSRVDLAGSIEDAEVLRGEHHYDLLILDINLPGRSGIEWEEALPIGSRADVILWPDTRILRPPSALSNWGKRFYPQAI